MRTQEERDEQTLDIVTMVIKGAFFWLLPILLLAALVSRYGGDLGPVAAVIAAYFVIVAVLLRRRSRR